MTRKLLTLLILLAVFFLTVAATYTNTTTDYITRTKLGPKENQTVIWKANQTIQLKYYISETVALTLSSHDPPVDPSYSGMLYEGPVSAVAVTVSTRYPFASISNFTGERVYAWVNSVTTTKRGIVIADSSYWILDLKQKNVGTIHTSGAGTGFVTIQEFH